MHHLPGIFAKRRQKKNTGQSQSPTPKLVRKNASYSFEYTPSPSPSPSSSGETPLVRETRSFDMPPSWEGASLRIDGDSGDVDVMRRSLGLSGPADFEIPSDMWESMKSMSLDDDDVAKRPKPGRSDSEKPEQPQLQNVDGAVNELFKGFDAAVKASVFVSTSNRSAESGHSNGIRGDRPPLLMTPAMLLPVLDSGLSTWDAVRSAEPVSEEHMLQGPVRVCSSGNNGDYGAATDNADQDELIEARFGETVLLSGSCSFTTSQDDDSSSSASLSPNGRAKVDSTNWQKGELLGEGFFFAVKEVSLLEQGAQGRQSVQQLEQEIDLLRQFEHENIVRYLGTDKDDSNLYIFLEFVTQGSLVSLYKTFHLQDSQVSAYTRQILFGLKYLHDKRVVHRDIKCANILVAADETATRLNDLKSCKGSAFWMAPEVVNRRNQGYGLPADIWSLGCTVLEMLTSHVPYHPLEFMTALFQIGNGIPPPVPRLLSRDARDFILRCLEVNPADRPTAADLLHHPFLKKSLPMGSESPLFRGSRWA